MGCGILDERAKYSYKTMEMSSFYFAGQYCETKYYLAGKRIINNYHHCYDQLLTDFLANGISRGFSRFVEMLTCHLVGE